MIHALRMHWPEYLMEAAELGLFLVSAGLFGTLLEYPQSPVHRAIADPLVRRAIMGVAMGLTAVDPIATPMSTRRAKGSAIARCTGDCGHSSNVPNRPAETMNSPSPAASMRYSGQCVRSAWIMAAI